jgi:hypothetical protein
MLELEHKLNRPHGLAKYIFWDFIAQELKETQSGETLDLMTAELVKKVCEHAAMAEVWLQLLEHQLAPPTEEQWARFQAMGKGAQMLAINVLTGAQARALTGKLVDRYADHYAIDQQDLVEVFEACLRELLVPFLEESIRMSGRHEAERALKGRIRASIDSARLQGLLPKVSKEQVADTVQHMEEEGSQISPVGKKRQARQYNIAFFHAFVDVLAEVACDLWKESRDITTATLRTKLKASTVEIEGSWKWLASSLSGVQLFRQVWRFQRKEERGRVRSYAEERCRAVPQPTTRSWLTPMKKKGQCGCSWEDATCRRVGRAECGRRPLAQLLRRLYSAPSLCGRLAAPTRWPCCQQCRC